MLGLLQIYQKSTRRSHGKRERIDSESLERIHLKLSSELLYSIVIYKCPFVESGNVLVVTVSLTDSLVVSSWDKKFLWSK